MHKTILAMCTGAVLLALAASLFLLARGAAAKPAGKLEIFAITAAKHHLLVGNKSARNPLPANSQNILEGRQNFLHYCYVCHGLDGQGTGVPFVDAMSPPLPSLASASVQGYSDGPAFLGHQEWLVAQWNATSQRHLKRRRNLVHRYVHPPPAARRQPPGSARLQRSTLR